MCFKDVPKLDMKPFGQRLRQAREEKGLSQEEFAALISKDQRAVSEYEHGKRRVSAVDLPVFARVLDVSLLYFYQDVTNPNDLEMAMLQQFRRIPTTEAQKAAIEIMRVFSNVLER
jgi:transcriptional regulator with XRE-family HTH domain